MSMLHSRRMRTLYSRLMISGVLFVLVVLATSAHAATHDAPTMTLPTSETASP